MDHGLQDVISHNDNDDRAKPATQENVLIAALPGALDYPGATTALFSHPPIPNDDFRGSPLHLRIESLERLQELFIPLERAADAFMRLYGLIRWSYSHRDPSNPRVMQMIHELALRGRYSNLPRQSSGGGGAIGLVLVGVTGAGKTSFLDAFLKYIGVRTIVHTSLGGRPCTWTQIPALRVQCPPKSSLVALAKSVLRAVDDTVGTTHVQNTNRLSQPELLLRMESVCSSLFLGGLIIDDLQNLREANFDTLELLKFLCNFMENTGIPLVVSGTYKLLCILRDNIAYGSKLASKGILDFAPLSPDSDEQLLLVEGYWAYSVLGSPIPMPAELPRLVAFHTQGVPRLIRILMIALHRRMAACEASPVSIEDHLREIARDELFIYQGPLNALRQLAAGTLTERMAAEFEDFIPIHRFTLTTKRSSPASSNRPPPVQPLANGLGTDASPKQPTPRPGHRNTHTTRKASRGEKPKSSKSKAQAHLGYSKWLELGFVCDSPEDILP